jgi:hypothetical protein
MDNLKTYEKIGIVFVGPIVGLPPSLVRVFDPLRAAGVGFEGVDIFERQNFKKDAWTILGLTMFPGSHNRRIRFANNFNESPVFEMIREKIEALKTRGKTKIILAGMSGGFVFASRMAQVPLESEVAPFALPVSASIKGLCGVSPIVFYPPGVLRIGSNLALIPEHIPTVLIWGDGDHIIPRGTIEYCENVSRSRSNMLCRVIHGPEVGLKAGSVQHQFFGGRDFIGPLKNIHWDKKAENIAREEIGKLVEGIQ